MDTKGFSELLAAMSRRMAKEKEWLTDLDNEIGDGDHGINMARGFAAVEKKLPELAGKDFGEVLKAVGMTLLSVVGGSAGPLYGTAFIRAGAVAAGKTGLDADGFLACLRAASEGVMQRGRAVRGEKTMLDAMLPALDAMEAEAAKGGASAKELVGAGVKAAWEGVEYTKTIFATKGRASYIGARSIGHQDPGATSFACLLEEIFLSL